MSILPLIFIAPEILRVCILRCVVAREMPVQFQQCPKDSLRVVPDVTFLRRRLRRLQIRVPTTLYCALINLFHLATSIPPSSPHNKGNLVFAKVFVELTLNSPSYRALHFHVT